MLDDGAETAVLRIVAPERVQENVPGWPDELVLAVFWQTGRIQWIVPFRRDDTTEAIEALSHYGMIPVWPPSWTLPHLNAVAPPDEDGDLPAELARHDATIRSIMAQMGGEGHPAERAARRSDAPEGAEACTPGQGGEMFDLSGDDDERIQTRRRKGRVFGVVPSRVAMRAGLWDGSFCRVRYAPTDGIVRIDPASEPYSSNTAGVVSVSADKNGALWIPVNLPDGLMLPETPVYQYGTDDGLVLAPVQSVQTEPAWKTRTRATLFGIAVSGWFVALMAFLLAELK